MFKVMTTVEARRGIPFKVRTAKELIHTLGANLSTLNTDISSTGQMPSIEPGEIGVEVFIGSLKRRHFNDLARAIDVVHRGELRIKKGKNFPSVQEKNKFHNSAEVIRDLSTVVEDNASLLNTFASSIPTMHYKGSTTRIGELVLTFYDLFLEALADRGGSLSNARQRSATLSKQKRFVLSPIMKIVNQNGGII